MAEFSANAQQVVNPGETVIFTETPVPCRRGLIRHRDDTGNFLLVGFVPKQFGCRCNRQQEAQYLVDFGANIAIPTGGTVGAISLAITMDGATLPASNMIVTPAAGSFSILAGQLTPLFLAVAVKLFLFAIQVTKLSWFKMLTLLLAAQIWRLFAKRTVKKLDDKFSQKRLD